MYVEERVRKSGGVGVFGVGVGELDGFGEEGGAPSLGSAGGTAESTSTDTRMLSRGRVRALW